MRSLRSILIAALILLGSAAAALAQNIVCVTAATSDSSSRCASTAFVHSVLSGGLSLNTNDIYVGNASNVAVGVPVSGDGSIVASGAFTLQAIQGKAIAGTTGTGNVVFSASPSFTGTITGPDSGTWTSSGFASTSLNNSSINNSTIGATIPAAGTFTALTTNGNTILGGTLTAASLATSGTIAGSLCETSAGVVLYEAGINCFNVAASSITIPTTTISGGINGLPLYDNAGAFGNSAAFLPTGYVNVLRNSSLTSWFHGCVGSACTITTSGGWCAEGVWVLPTGASVTCQQTTTVPSGSPAYYGVKITGASSVTGLIVRFVQESYSAAKIAGQTSTFQLTWINNSGSSITPTLQTKYAGSQDSWGSPTTDLSATNMQACTNGATCTEAYTFAASSSAINGYEENVNFGNNFGSVSDTLTIGGGFDLRATPTLSTGTNSAPPPPEVRDAESDIRWNERFYQASYPNQTAPATAQTNGMAGGALNLGSSTAYAFASIPFRTQMRATPAVNYYDTAGTQNKATLIATGGATLTTGTTLVTGSTQISTTGFQIQAGNASTQGMYFIQYTADATISGG